jgi:hypothetical protein
MSLAVLLGFLQANQGIIVTVLLAISEYLGANPKIKSNGILSLILIQVHQALKAKKEKV